jgi:hypothetical protein
MDFPRWVFTSPGDIKVGGKSYGQQIVNDEVEHKAALSAGWYDTVLDAFDAVGKPVAPKPETVKAEAPIVEPRQDALIAKAEKLGIKVDKRWGAEKLAAEIAKAEES